jgi:hypothetical protein
MRRAVCASLRPRSGTSSSLGRGKSACIVGQALEENGKGKLYAIDPHTNTDWNDIMSVDTYELMRKHLGFFGLLRKTCSGLRTRGA